MRIASIELHQPGRELDLRQFRSSFDSALVLIVYHDQEYTTHPNNGGSGIAHNNTPNRGHEREIAANNHYHDQTVQQHSLHQVDTHQRDVGDSCSADRRGPPGVRFDDSGTPWDGSDQTHQHLKA